jgi:hypothetical protein
MGTSGRVHLRAGGIILSQNGCNLNRNIDTAKCETDSENRKKISEYLGNYSVFGVVSK